MSFTYSGANGGVNYNYTAEVFKNDNKMNTFSIVYAYLQNSLIKLDWDRFGFNCFLNDGAYISFAMAWAFWIYLGPYTANAVRYRT